MALKSGTMLGPYEVLAPIGAGGMGEVYKGRDTRLNRDVAIKVLPEHLSLNAELRERFPREAETIANLKHPHICVLYDIGEQASVQYLVMEYLEGETLAARLQSRNPSRAREQAVLPRRESTPLPDGRGSDSNPLPLDQVLRYAIEISDALDKAHRKGATHRDIKPGNIMLTKEGSKLLDFGLAKLKQQTRKPVALGPDDPTPPLGSPLLASAESPGSPGQGGKPTIEGTILGTVQYMSPEQVEGRIDDIDGRSDIFSFGATLYEMLTGRKCFEGKSPASVLAKILEHEPPPVSALQPLSPQAMDYVVRTCLAKDRDERWQSATDLCRELKRIRDGGSQAGTAAPMRAESKSRERLAWAVAGIAVAALLVMAGQVLRRQQPEGGSIIRFSLPAPNAAFLYSLAVSPDGQYVSYTAPIPDGSESIWIRPLDSPEARPLPGTERAMWQFWSPDSRHLAFFADGKLKRVDVLGGAPQTICEIAGFRGGA